MYPPASTELYSRREIALATGVPEGDVLALLGPAREFVPHDEAVRVGRLLIAGAPRAPRAPVRGAPASGDVGGATASRIPQLRSVPLAVSTAVHVALAAFVLLATFNLTP